MSRPPPVLIEKHYVPYDLYVSHYLTPVGTAHTHTYSSSSNAPGRPVSSPNIPPRPQQSTASTFNTMFSNLFGSNTTTATSRSNPPTDRQSVYVRTYETTLPVSASDMDLSALGTLFSTLMNSPGSYLQPRLSQTEINNNSQIIDFDTATRLDTACSICTNEWTDDESEIRKLNICGHLFHKNCIDRWLTDHNTCPLCRTNVVSGMDDVD